MNQCKACGFENADINRFCEKCGTKLESLETPKFCRNCGKETIPGTAFCTACGKPLQITAEGSRKGECQETVPAVKKKKKVGAAAAAIAGIAVLVVVGVITVRSGILKQNVVEEDRDRKDNEAVEPKNEVTEQGTEAVFGSEALTEEETAESTETAQTEEAVKINKNVDDSAPIPVKATVTASSALEEEGLKVSALTDFDANTAWGEGAEGLGDGEYVIYRFDEATDIFGIAILPGKLSSTGDFYRYACPTELLVTAGGKTQSIRMESFSAEIKKTTNPYLYLNLEEPVHTDELMIAIADTREGTEKETTCITEMHAYTYPLLDDKDAFSVDAWKIIYPEENAYILPESNTRFLEISDLEGLTADECRLARNELYARHGRRFDDEFLRTYFETKEWYEGTIEAADFDDSVLNEYEMANRDLIVEFEKEQGYRE